MAIPDVARDSAATQMGNYARSLEPILSGYALAYAEYVLGLQDHPPQEPDPAAGCTMIRRHLDGIWQARNAAGEVRATVACLPLAGLPRACPYCSAEPGQWPLGVFALRVCVICPKCHSSVVPVVAVPPAALAATGTE